MKVLLTSLHYPSFINIKKLKNIFSKKKFKQIKFKKQDKIRVYVKNKRIVINILQVIHQNNSYFINRK